MLKDDDWLEKAKFLKQKADKKFKGGDLAGCEDDLKLAKLIIEDRTGSFEKRRKQV